LDAAAHALSADHRKDFIRTEFVTDRKAMRLIQPNLLDQKVDYS
jgi:hypothetical protein